jgi:hypothetical protein
MTTLETKRNPARSLRWHLRALIEKAQRLHVATGDDRHALIAAALQARLWRRAAGGGG